MIVRVLFASHFFPIGNDYNDQTMPALDTHAPICRSSCRIGPLCGCSHYLTEPSSGPQSACPMESLLPEIEILLGEDASRNHERQIHIFHFPVLAQGHTLSDSPCRPIVWCRQWGLCKIRDCLVFSVGQLRKCEPRTMNSRLVRC